MFAIALTDPSPFGARSLRLERRERGLGWMTAPDGSGLLRLFSNRSSTDDDAGLLSPKRISGLTSERPLLAG